MLGLFEGDRLAEHWRVATEAERTGDELGALVGRLLELRDLGFEEISGVCLSTTVPVLVRAYTEFAETLRRGADPRRRPGDEDRRARSATTIPARSARTGS